jgi:hypothetical protein
VPLPKRHQSLYPKILAGKKRIALMSAKAAPMAKPTKISGSEMSQTKGHSTKANSASGQLTVNKMDQATRIRSTFIAASPKTLDATTDDGDRFQDCHIESLGTVRQGRFFGNAVELHEHAAVDCNRHQHGKAETDQAGCPI